MPYKMYSNDAFDLLSMQVQKVGIELNSLKDLAKSFVLEEDPDVKRLGQVVLKLVGDIFKIHAELYNLPVGGLAQTPMSEGSIRRIIRREIRRRARD